MRIIRDIEQGTKEWHDLRRGRITGTKLEDVMGSAMNRLELIAELIAEEGTEQSKIMRPTPDMERGAAEEIFAVRAFEEKIGKKIERVTMIISDEFDWLALSPDGLIPDRKGKYAQYTEGVEIKNPNSSTMIMYKIANMVDGAPIPASKRHFLGVPAAYKWQIVHNFIVNDELERLHFVVYDARFIEQDHKLYTVTIERDSQDLQQCIREAREALVSFREEWLRVRDIVLPSNF